MKILGRGVQEFEPGQVSETQIYRQTATNEDIAIVILL